jgi:hypothetical protein
MEGAASPDDAPANSLRHLSEIVLDQWPGVVEQIAEVITDEERRKAEAVGQAVLSLLREQLLGTGNGLVGTTGASEVVGISKQRVYQLAAVGRFPPPFAFVDGTRPVWLRSDLELFRLGRMIGGSKTP